MTQILDLHTHSKYSRACSKHLELPEIARTCEIRGIDIVSASDITHPRWFAHMKEWLVESSPGIYKLQETKYKQLPNFNGHVPQTKFILSTEIACIKKHKNKTRRVHVLVFCPTLEVVEQLNTSLTNDGFNLHSDGRPILGMTVKTLLEYIKNIDSRCYIIPAHAWTPWFGIFGSKGGYDSLEEAFDELAPEIFAIETGLSSDPLMNWHLSMLDNITLISNSDAHSPAKLGREANIMQFASEDVITYDEIFDILRTQDKNRFLRTIEFYPEEGKYHMDGHRDCGVSFYPEETKTHKGICPKCKKPLVIGVMHRVMELGDRTKEEAKEHGKTRVLYTSLVPLAEIIADTVQKGWATKTVQATYQKLVTELGSEFHILLDVSLSNIEKASTKQIAIAIDRVRKRNIVIKPGYDGEFGAVKIFENNEERGGAKQETIEF
ncbi:MAG: DNA helicase UvrD [Candidatus Magasanikbacteria bacterium CG_4_9_14_0_2_um_filter_41_10]|uniref:DNA helicase UvrD n=1 Tax=Candidatus Magasanikbacteria bacterium CG_4_10_14_0_2_um_filter_41_31 TaxID=1974639 RepID=A0A2M7V2T1_9BACT|nr:MAG: DNA helicase UvrD [Candidatus Magasanikbacteria bacterium CG_4_10_14_0_2_um_filter_41_31]PJC53053.1 MAG: DNA helicase UvrD [Candidatus Magasanikbacteria bacterium CG_4_9_14_0_2_um_filter_41_10]